MMQARFPQKLMEASSLMRIAPLPLIERVFHLPLGGRIASFCFSHVSKDSFVSAELLGSRIVNMFHMPRTPVPPGIGVFFSTYGERLNATISCLDGIFSDEELDKLEQDLRCSSLREFPDNVTCDVLVAGGGVAGVAAAVSAARKGCSVVLAERSERLGGIGTRGMLRGICGLYRNGGAEPAETLNRGIVREVVYELRERAPGRAIQKAGKVFVLPCASMDLEAVLLSLCEAEQGLTVASRKARLLAVKRPLREKSADVTLGP